MFLEISQLEPIYIFSDKISALWFFSSHPFLFRDKLNPQRKNMIQKQKFLN